MFFTELLDYIRDKFTNGILEEAGDLDMGEKHFLPRRRVRRLRAILEQAVGNTEAILERYNGLTEDARTEIRKVMESNLGEFEYLALVTEDSYGEIHTNRLREGMYFNDPVALRCAAVTETTVSFYPRNTGEKLIDVSSPIRLNGKKVYTLRIGEILYTTSRHIKLGVPFFAAQTIGFWGIIFARSVPVKLGALLALVLAAVFILIDRVQFHRAYREWIRFMRAIAKGDLKYRLSPKSRDEFGQMEFELNKVSIGISEIVAKVSQSVEKVAAAAHDLTMSAGETSKATEHIATTVQDMTEGSETQARSVDLSADAMNQMSHGVQQIAANAENVSRSAVSTSKVAADGYRSIQTAIEQMTSINKTVDALADVVKGLGTRSEEIGQIVEVITNIASQTNLLALNAAIEAARAGEHGRGFAVVAGEVGKLADQTTASAGRIVSLVSAIQHETHKAVETTQKAAMEAATGIRDVNAAGESLDKIQSAIDEVAGQIQEISKAIGHISENTSNVVESIDAIAKVAEQASVETQNVSTATEEQLASMQEIAASATTLNNMSLELSKLAGRFQV